jgi:hypothetical protein
MAQPELTVIALDDDDTLEPEFTQSVPPSADELLRMYDDFSLAPSLAKVYTELGAPRPRAHMTTADVQNFTLPSDPDESDEDED